MSDLEARARAYAKNFRRTIQDPAVQGYLEAARKEVELERKRILNLLTKFIAPDELGVIRITDSFLREIINGEGEK